MKEFEIEIEINATPKKAWDVFVDLDNYGKWNPVIPSGKGKLEVNNTLELIWERATKTVVFRPKIVAIEPHQRFTFSTTILHTQLAHLMHHFEFEAIDNDAGTRLVQRWECTGLMIPLLWGVLLPGFKEFENMSIGLKDYVEGSSTEPQPSNIRNS